MEIIRSKTVKSLALGWVRFLIAFVIVAAISAVAGHEAQSMRDAAAPHYSVQYCSK